MSEAVIRIPEDLHQRMLAHPEIRWSEVVRGVLERKLRDLELLDRVAKASTLTDADVDELDHLVKDALLRRARAKDA